MAYSVHLQQIRDMVAVDRIMEQVRGQLGINDKVLAEYLLAMAK